MLKSLPIDVDTRTVERATGEAIALARLYTLTIYDAAYLELCVREALPLATADQDLIAACKKAGVQRFLSDASTCS